MKSIFNHKRYFETSLNLRIEYINEDGFLNIEWFNGDLKVGIFSYFIKDDYVIILGYNKYKDVPRGVGYKFIKMCIDDLLKKYKGIFSKDKDRSVYSDIIWEKLEKEYEVVNLKLVDYQGKIIYSL